MKLTDMAAALGKPSSAVLSDAKDETLSLGVLGPIPKALDRTAGKTKDEIAAERTRLNAKHAKAMVEIKNPKLKVGSGKPMLPKTIEPAGKALMKEIETVKKTKTKERLASLRAKSPKAKVAKASAPSDGVRKSSKTEIVAKLLQRASGCTNEDILSGTGWPTVSVPAMAKAAGLKLRKEKVTGKPTRYWGS